MELELSRIDELEASRLEAPFSKEEIKTALFELRGDKAPGPNGFTVVLWQENWDTIKGEIMNMIKDFHNTGIFVKSLNTTFIVLIPKKEAEDLKDFKPISLVGSVYKWIAKVLANRLKWVVGKVVNVA